PGKPKPWREFPPVLVSACLTLKTRVPREGKAKRCFLKCRAPDTRSAGLVAVFCDPAESQILCKIGLPAQSIVKGQAFCDFPAICNVSCDIPFSHVVRIRRRLHECARFAEQEARQSQSRSRAIEGERA